MEFNGLANLHLLLEKIPVWEDEEAKAYEQIKEQLDLLERYMLAVSDAQAKAELFWQTATGLSTYVELPMWHEIKANPKAYPNGRERLDGIKKQMAGE